MKKARRDFLKAAGAAAIGAGAYLSASRRGYAQTPPAFKWKAQCLWSPAETSYKAFEDFFKRIFAMTNGRPNHPPSPRDRYAPQHRMRGGG